MPAKISPMTVGWPSALKITPMKRATRMITVKGKPSQHTDVCYKTVKAVYGRFLEAFVAPAMSRKSCDEVA